jgi:hypothetical protein
MVVTTKCGAGDRSVVLGFERLESDTSKLVVLYLRQVGDATPDELAARLDVPLLTALSTLDRLAELGLIDRLDGSERVVPAGPAAAGGGGEIPTAPSAAERPPAPEGGPEIRPSP